MCLAICNQKFWSFLLVLYNDFKDPGVLADSASATLCAMVQCWETHIQTYAATSDHDRMHKRSCKILQLVKLQFQRS
jgi:hypothetical protein